MPGGAYGDGWNLIQLKTGYDKIVCLFVTEELPITVSRRAPDKEAWPYYHHLKFGLSEKHTKFEKIFLMVLKN